MAVGSAGGRHHGFYVGDRDERHTGGPKDTRSRSGISNMTALDESEDTGRLRDGDQIIPLPVRFSPWPPFLLGVAALVGIGFFVVFAPRAAAGGWLAAFVFWSGVSIGSVTAIMIHALTGGRWGLRFAAVFIPSAAAIPLMGVLFVPVLVEISYFYPWVSTASNVAPDVSRYYLNVPFFIGRSAIAFLLWSFLAFSLPRLTGWLEVLVAAIGLACFGLLIGPIGVDWILSLEPAFISDSFGVSLAITQLASALAWALIISAGTEEDIGLADLGGLLLATLLGITYINFIAVLVIWYGDLPSRVFWFVNRGAWPWKATAVFAFAFASVVPIFSLFLERVRSSRVGLRAVGVITLVGLAGYDAYLVAPPFGVLSLAAALLSVVAIGALFVAFLGTAFAQARFYKWRSAFAR